MGLKSLILAAAATAALAAAKTAMAATVTISCGALGAELQLCQQGAEAWAQKTGNQVKVVSTPSSATERLALYQQMLAARSGDIDVYQIDVIWPGLLSQHFEDLSGAVDKATLAKHFPSIVENNTVDGRLVGMPWFTDVGLLYYRTDLLEKYDRPVPTTWAEMEESARVIVEGERKEGDQRLQGFVFQGKAYEGLTCNALEWIDSHGGGSIVAGDGEITVANPQAVEAIGKAAGWIGTITPQGSLNYGEEEARGVFQSGDAVFMRNWPYAWSLAQGPDSPVKDKVGVAALPKGGDQGKHSGTLGGWQLAVSTYSANKEAAMDLVRYLAGEEEQKRRAMEGSFLPTIQSLYQDEETLKAVPIMRELVDSLKNAVARPATVTGDRYNQVSTEFFTAVHSVLTGQRQADVAMQDLQRRLDRLSRGGRW
ncbi:ABC transporter substrate-binding protein [Rhodospirillum centenum]|uniref:Sugar ABC transporter, periplasmic sugar-binding protein, putative n=1 Tax=Rhodospirillum centenum (strain ATCC 51521 / SW) TaxID=414684 RepID=B6IXQ3_RHOCS|nr:ABC transporter substrate-binding protein [Rhodospirillum centenum]ACJ01077.1 sugar ABC transporter, periplasmic sugar-binding protein, putative [Rhodospirillum centenum SW]